MKKKAALLALVALLTLVTAVPALAGQGPGQGGPVGEEPFSAVGTVTAVGSESITFAAVNNRFAGQELTVQVTSATQFLAWTPYGRVPSDFSAVEVGDAVNVQGTTVDGVFVAEQVIVDVPLTCFN